jgi:hypothetical protein
MQLNGKNARVLFAALAALGLSLVGAADCRAEEPLSPGLIQFWQNLTPAAQQDAVVALQNLTPAGLQALQRRPFLAQPRSSAQFIVNVHASLPWEDQQRFMNSFFGVPGDELFAEAKCREYALRRTRQAARLIQDAGEISGAVNQASRAFHIR